MWHSLSEWISEPLNQNLLMGVVIAFGLGVFIGGWVRRGKGKKAKTVFSKGEKAFFKGFHYMLSNDHDHAIEEFTKSVKLNSDTIETYVALGNLYRSRGDIDRAIHIRQSIIHRPNINEQIMLQTLFDLGLDYKKGGVLNRALNAFQKVLQSRPSDLRTLEEIERIYEETKDWDNAYQTRKKIARVTKGDHHHILAHHLVESGKVCQQDGDLANAKTYFNKAVTTDKSCVDAYLHLGDLHFSKQEYKKAISMWKKVVEVSPQFTFLAYKRLEGAYAKMKNLKPVEDFLKDCVRSNSDAFTHLALARYLHNDDDIEGALQEVMNALELEPSLWEARKLKGEILLAQGKQKEALADYGELIELLDIPYLRFQCKKCGFEPKELQWQCPQCRTWDTIRLIDYGGAGPKNTPLERERPPQIPGRAEE